MPQSYLLLCGKAHASLTVGGNYQQRLLAPASLEPEYESGGRFRSMRDRTRVQSPKTEIGRVVHQPAIFKSQGNVLYRWDREVSSSSINEDSYGLTLHTGDKSAIVPGIEDQRAAFGQ